jgi:hypothetical protein
MNSSAIAIVVATTRLLIVLVNTGCMSLFARPHASRTMRTISATKNIVPAIVLMVVLCGAWYGWKHTLLVF